ncbi:MAG TPA: hypothetical protein VFX02_03720 [Gammaproteobacteria bacterium]|nr:hypothetical protein [Gammaproteobacteria bacterium]
MKGLIGIFVVAIILGIFIAHENQESRREYGKDLSACQTSATKLAEGVARQTGDYKLSASIEQAFIDVCIRQSPSMEGIRKFAESEGNDVFRKEKERLEDLLVAAREKGYQDKKD